MIMKEKNTWVYMDSKFKKAPIHIEFLAIKYTLKKKKKL